MVTSKIDSVLFAISPEATLLRLGQKNHHPDTLDFQYSPGYLAQATRNGRNNYVSSDGAVIYTHLNPDPSSQYVIVASAGKDRDKAIAKAARILAKSSGQDVIVKNVGLESRLSEPGFEDYREDESWDEYSKYDDNTFPQQVIDTYSYSLEGSQFAKLREQIGRFDRDHLVMDILIGGHPNPRVEMAGTGYFKSLLRIWAQQMAERKGLDADEFIRTNEMFGPENRKFLHYSFSDLDSNKPFGALTFSEISQHCLGLNAVINDFSFNNSSRYLTHRAILLAKDLGYRHLNLQGSEDENQHRSKRKFRAPIEIPKKHLVFRAKR